MNKGNKLFDKLFKSFGLLAFLVGFSGSLLSLISTPDYKMWLLSISMLTLAPTGIYLRFGLIFANILAIPFIVYLGRAQKVDNINEKIRKFAIGTGIFSCVSAVLTGVVTGTNPIISTLHGLFALFSWIGGSITCSVFSYLLLKNTKFTKGITFSGFIVAGIVIGFLVPFFITNFCSYFADLCYSFGQIVYTIMPLWEWVVVFSFLFWYLSNSAYMLYKKI